MARFSPMAEFLAEPADPEALRRLRRAETIGRPLGDADFLAGLERRFKRALKPARRGPKPTRGDEGRQGKLI
jgi:putative transposase